MRFPVIQLALAAAVAGARDLLGEIQSTASALEPRAQPATAPRIDLKQAESNLTYLASVEIGEPGQAIDLEVSTSADWTWVPAKDDTGCDGGACTHGTYDVNASSSAVEVTGKTLAAVDENDAKIAGQYFNDTWLLGDTTAFKSFSFAAGTSAKRTFGSLGLGGAKKAVANSTSLVASMAAASLSATSAYSLWLGSLTDKTGSLLFGGIDTSKFQGTLTRLTTHPLQLDATTDGALGVELNSVTAASPSGEDVLPFGTTPLLVELRLGTSLITLPDDLVEGIWTETGAKAAAAAPGTAQVPCQMGNSPGLFSFKFAGTLRINVSMASLVLPKDLEPASATATLFNVSDDVLCQFAIVKGGATFGLGETFLRSAYAVFDQENTEIGVAQSNPEPTSSYVIQFPSSGAFIPLATPAPDATDPYPTAVISASATPLATFSAAKGFQTFVPTVAKPAPAGVPTAAVAAGVVVGVIAILFGLAAWRVGVAKKPLPFLRHVPGLRDHVPPAWLHARDATELESKPPQPPAATNNAAAEAVGFPCALGQPASWNELESHSHPTELEGDLAFRPDHDDRRRRRKRRPPSGRCWYEGVRRRDRPVCAPRSGAGASASGGYTPPESPVTGTFPPTCTSTPSRASVASLPGERAMTFLSTSSTTSDEDDTTANAAPSIATNSTPTLQTVEYLGPPLRALTSSPRDARTGLLVQHRMAFPRPPTTTPSPVSLTPPPPVATVVGGGTSSWKLVTSAVELPPPPATPSPPSRASSPAAPSSANVSSSSPEATEPRSPGRQWV